MAAAPDAAHINPPLAVEVAAANCNTSTASCRTSCPVHGRGQGMLQRAQLCDGASSCHNNMSHSQSPQHVALMESHCLYGSHAVRDNFTSADKAGRRARGHPDGSRLAPMTTRTGKVVCHTLMQQLLM
jgi:hypothetical protein